MVDISRGRRSRALAYAWLSLLALGQIADLVTTQAAMAKGAIEGNAIAAAILGAGGLGLLWVVKTMLVAAMALAVLVVRRYWDESADHRAAFAAKLVWRGLQMCVVVLAITAVNNLTVLRSMTS